MSMLERAGLRIATVLDRFIVDQVLPGTGIEATAFWSGVADIYARFTPENRALLRKRDALQAQIDAWHQQRPGLPPDPAAYQSFLRDIGYLVAEPAAFSVAPTRVDDEIALLAGPQLVVPLVGRAAVEIGYVGTLATVPISAPVMPLSCRMPPVLRMRYTSRPYALMGSLCKLPSPSPVISRLQSSSPL